MKAIPTLLLKQSLVMTSEMRLAINILSMNSLEIEKLIDEELRKNPCLEEDDRYFGRPEHFLSTSSRDASALEGALRKTPRIEDFREQLLHQVGEGAFNCVESDIATMIINNLDDDGFLSDAEAVYYLIEEKLLVYPEWIESVRMRIMALDPLGCAAKSVNETLAYQAQQKCQFLHHDFSATLLAFEKNPLQKITRELIGAIKNDPRLFELKMLNPRPSLPCQASEKEHLIWPDIAVNSESRGTACVELTSRPSRRLVLHKRYKLLTEKTVHTLIKDGHRRALVLLRSLIFRENSLLLVARLVVEAQADWFFHHGPLKPLHLHDISSLAGVHESSVSRLVQGKYLLCVRGVYALKYFFGPALKQKNGPHPSTHFVKEKIYSLIAKENKATPFSDQKIKELLFSDNIAISRRTVAKYRDTLKIAPAHERRL